MVVDGVIVVVAVGVAVIVAVGVGVATVGVVEGVGVTVGVTSTKEFWPPTTNLGIKSILTKSSSFDEYADNLIGVSFLGGTDNWYSFCFPRKPHFILFLPL